MVKITCSNCGKNLEAPEDAEGKKGKCSGCGEVFVVGKTEEEEVVHLGEKRCPPGGKTNYPVLKSISNVCKILAWMNFLTAVLFFVLVLVRMPGKIEVPGMMTAVTFSRAPFAIPILILGAMAFIFFYAFAESILVFLDVESNTRRSADMAAETLEILERRENDVK